MTTAINHWSVGKVAYVMRTSSRTVKKLFDIKKLRGYRIGNDRRFSPLDVLQYLRENGMPTDRFYERVGGSGRVLLLTSNNEFASKLKRCCTHEVTHCRDTFTAGTKMYCIFPSVVVIDAEYGACTCANIVEKTAEIFPVMPLMVAIVHADQANDFQEFHVRLPPIAEEVARVIQEKIREEY